LLLAYLIILWAILRLALIYSLKFHEDQDNFIITSFVHLSNVHYINFNYLALILHYDPIINLDDFDIHIHIFDELDYNLKIVPLILMKHFHFNDSSILIIIAIILHPKICFFIIFIIRFFLIVQHCRYIC
jgi:hypothetical protein